MRRLLLLLALGAAVRAPFWLEAWRTPLDGDLAVVGVMARHPFAGTTLWGQPYGSPLEAWLLAPLFALCGATPGVLRAFYFALGLLLVPLAFALGRALHPRAALPAALLTAVAPPYVLLLSALPPPLYPLALLLDGGVLLVALHLGPRLARGERPRVALVAWGALGGLALWTHLMSSSVVAATSALLGRRAMQAARGSLLSASGRLAWGLIALSAASAPSWLHFIAGERAAAVLSPSSRRESAAEHLRGLLPRLHEPIGGLLGTHVPLIADDPDHAVHAPAWAAAALIVAWLGVAVVVVNGKRRASSSTAGGAEPAAPLLLVVTAGLVLLAFVVPARSGPQTVRFLTPAFLPLAALAGWACVRGLGSRAWMAALALAALTLPTSARLYGAWHTSERAAPPFRSPDLAPVIRFLGERGLGHAWASYAVAWRLTFESGECVIASQPWNERFRHEPLPLRDEVRFARDVAWVLTPDLPSDLPTPRAFEDALGRIGGTFRRDTVGPALIYHAFAPPYGPEVEPLATAGAAGDGDLSTRIEPRDPRSALTFTLPEPRPLDGLALFAGDSAPTLPRSLDVAVSADGRTFDVVARRRRRGERDDLRWVGGQPQAVLDHDVLPIALGGRRVAAVRLTPVDSDEPWALAEVLLHPATSEARPRPWDDWLPPRLTWPERREALARDPRRNREDWYSRTQLAARR